MTTPATTSETDTPATTSETDIDIGTGNDDSWKDIRVRFHIFETFIHSGLHPNPPFVGDVYAVAQVTALRDGSNDTVTKPIFAKNDTSSPAIHIHAEKTLIFNLHAFLLRLQDAPGGGIATCFTVTIWINFSPCYRCSRRFLKFIDVMRKKEVDMSMEIIFPHFYKIRRDYCVQNQCQHNLPSETDHRKNVGGLLRLTRGGVVLKTFNGEEWKMLGKALRIDYRVPANRTQEDDNIRQDFLNMTKKE